MATTYRPENTPVGLDAKAAARWQRYYAAALTACQKRGGTDAESCRQRAAGAASWKLAVEEITGGSTPALAAAAPPRFVADEQIALPPAGEQVIRLRDSGRVRELRAHERASVDALLALVACDRGATKPVPHDPLMDRLAKYLPQHAAETAPALVDRQIQSRDEDAVAAAWARARDREARGVVTAEDWHEVGRQLRRSLPGLREGRTSTAGLPDEE